MRRWRGIWPWVVAVLALVLLAVSQVEFVPEEERPPPFNPLDIFRQPSSSLPASPAPQPQSSLPDLDTAIGRLFLYVLIPLALTIYVLSLLFSPQTRRHAMVLLVTFLLAVAMLLILLSSRNSVLSGASGQPQVGGPPAATDLPTIAPPEPAGWAIWLVATVLAAAMLGGAYFLWRRFFRPRRSLDRLAEQAQAALGELQGGADLRDVVIRCYVEMSRIVEERRGLRRRESLTPREFARKLEAAGLPAVAVDRLTRLFEQVRYADRHPGPAEQQEAIACLAAIVAAVGETR